MVTVERTTTPELEKRTRLLAAVLVVLGGLAILAPLMAGANAESRVGLVLIVAAVIELYHGFRRSSDGGRRAAWQSGAVTVLMGILILGGLEGFLVKLVFGEDVLVSTPIAVCVILANIAQ